MRRRVLKKKEPALGSSAEAPPELADAASDSSMASASVVADGHGDPPTPVKRALSPPGRRIARRIRRSPWKRYLIIGFLSGILAAAVVHFQVHQPIKSTVQELRDQLIRQLPALSLSMITNATELRAMLDTLKFPEFLSLSQKPAADYARPGAELRRTRDLRALHPVFLVPGIVSTGLELWEGDECAKKYFRQRMWGTLTMLQTILLDRYCWLKHLELNATTGLDPEGIKLRAAVGLEAADWFMPSYWVWAPVIENLADLGYDNTNLEMSSYDWRLAFDLLEVRDGYYSRLKASIETAVRRSGKRAVVLAHSMGSLVFFYFLSWVQSSKLRASLAPSLTLPPRGRRGRVELYRSWGSLPSMLLLGGDRLWGRPGPGAAPDGFPHVALFPDSPDSNPARHGNMTVEEAHDLIFKVAGAAYAAGVQGRYSYGSTPPAPGAGPAPPRSWANALEAPLPAAPNMKIYCLYGTGKPTERAYVFKGQASPKAEEVSGEEDAHPVSYQIDYSVHDAGANLSYGVLSGDGDGTVPLVSLGFVCRRAWRTPALNPAGIPVTTKEYTDLDVRSGPLAAAHVDILGNRELLRDVLLVAAGRGEEVQERVASDIDAVAARVQL
eukprot:tig00020816_g14159.t1